MEHIIAKIDLDFNPSNSDWIPRAPAWVIDAMSQLKIFSVEIKNRKIPVFDNIAILPYTIHPNKIKVFDSKGVRVKELNKEEYERINYSTGGVSESYIETFSLEEGGLNVSQAIEKQNTIINYPTKHYVILDSNRLEVTFNTDFITIEQPEIETYFSDTFNCMLPVIPNNGLLIEGLCVYCLYKMLSRGDKHPVFALNVGDEIRNPYIRWSNLKAKIKTSVIIDAQGDIYDSNIWQSMFYNITFK